MVAMPATEGVVTVKDMEREQPESDVTDGEEGGVASSSTGGGEFVLDAEFVKWPFMGLRGRQDRHDARVLRIEKGLDSERVRAGKC